jgi:hypothetical protein
MAVLNFPNASRSYDQRQRRVRFWAHDAALEIPFFLDAAALLFINPMTAVDEAGLLKTFDINRGAIESAAARVYRRHARGSYILMASDFA